MVGRTHRTGDGLYAIFSLGCKKADKWKKFHQSQNIWPHWKKWYLSNLNRSAKVKGKGVCVLNGKFKITFPKTGYSFINS